MKLFLADSNIYYKDCHSRVEANIAFCSEHGFEAFHPLKSNFHAKEGMTPHEMAAAIAQNNLKQLDSCDVLMAELDPWRGCEVDTGVSFEVGYMLAKGKKIYGYMKDAATTYCTRYPVKTFDEEDGVYRDEQGRRLEEFGLPVNLMVATNLILVEGGFQDAVKKLYEDMK